VSRSRAEAAPSFIYVPELGARGDELVLGTEESHYLARVCRARAGQMVSGTDGRGAVARLTLISVRPQVRVRLDAIEHEDRAREAVVWCGAPEGARADCLVEKLGEFGISALQPVDCARAAWRITGARRARWQRVAISALRQSRGSRLMLIEPPLPLAAALESIPPGASRWLADPGGSPGQRPGPGRLSIGAVGPSGGFSPDEIALLQSAGFTPIPLASVRLRSETAALAWAAWWAAGAD
jgi:16S rRNA (uracil1498-N3)-methyltransferase